MNHVGWRIGERTFIHGRQANDVSNKLVELPFLPITEGGDFFPNEVCLVLDMESSREQNCRNARLIAAAPEMAELLVGMLMYPDVREHLASRFPGLVKKIEAVCARVEAV